MRALRPGARLLVLAALATLIAIVVAAPSSATPPGITVPGNKTVEATSTAGAVVNFSGEVTSDDPAAVIACAPASGTTFAFGPTTVDCTATNAANETASGSFTITVVDTTKPSVSVPGDLSKNATLPGGTTVSYAASASDNIDGSISPNCDHASGSNFPVGTTKVTCTPTDAHGNSTSASFNVTVTLVDTTKPVVVAPSNITAEATSAAGAVVSFTATATDNLDGTLTPTCAPPSGSTFPIGATNDTCSATDAHGNTGTDSFTVTVRDTTKPTVSVPADIRKDTTTGTGTTVDFVVSANDNIDGPLTPSCNHPSGSNFPVGVTTVSCSATDAHTNTTTATFRVTVVLVDTTKPVVVAPANIIREATSAGGAAVTFSASATDNVDGPLTPTCTPPSGSTFPITVTTVTCTATDAHGNTGTDSFTITVHDTTKPTVSVPADITADATSPNGASVSFTATANDNIDGSIVATCNPASGATFPIGTTTVACTATDAHGNAGNASFKVTVKDSAGPVVTVPAAPIVAEATGPTGAPATFTVTATDAIDGPIAPPSITCTPASGSTFALGTTHVSCVAHDNSGNPGTGKFDVVVQDTTPPRLNIPAKITLSTPDGGPLPPTQTSIASFLAAPRASDLVDGATPVTSDAPNSFPVGRTTIVFTTKDKAGNSVSASSTVTVVYTPAAPPLVPPPSDAKPPPDPGAVKATGANRKVVISWKAPAATDLDHYVVELSAASGPPSVAYTGTALSYTAGALTNGVQYRFVVLAVDKAGNKSTGVAVTATPNAPPLVKPADGAVVSTLPQLVWKPVAGATYYNLQLYRMPSLAAIGGRKILSAWPTSTSLTLKGTWKFAGATYRLSPGVYRWFVWPGLGARANGKYGPLIGSSSFVVKTIAKPKAKPKPKSKAKPKTKAGKRR